MAFDFTPLLPAGAPPAALRWTGSARFNFIGGNNDADAVPLAGLMAAAQSVLAREGRTLSHYGLSSGPQGYRRLREFLSAKLKRDAGMTCTADDMRPLAEAAGFTPGVWKWKDEERALLRAELDAAYFHLYQLSREDVEYILGTFQGIAREDERAGGEGQTRRLVLAAFNGMCA